MVTTDDPSARAPSPTDRHAHDHVRIARRPRKDGSHVCSRPHSPYSPPPPSLALAGCGDDSEPATRTPSSGKTRHASDHATRVRAPDAGGDGPPSASRHGRRCRSTSSATPRRASGCSASSARSRPTTRPREALALMTAGDALDPDYSTLYPSGTFTTSPTTSTIVVGAARRLLDPAPDGMSRGPGAGSRSSSSSTRSRASARSALPVDRPARRRARRPRSASDGRGDRSDPSSTYVALVNITTPEEGQPGQRHVHRERRLQLVRGHRRRGRSARAAPTARSSRRASPPPTGWMDKLYPWETEVDVSGLARRRLHLRRDDRRPVRAARAAARRSTPRRSR